MGGELPHFIAGVPEETIKKQSPSPLPSRIFVVIEKELAASAAFVDIYKVPDDSILEIRSIQASAVSGNAPILTSYGKFKLIVTNSAGGNARNLIDLRFYSQKSEIFYASYGELSQFVEADNNIKLEINAGIANTNFFSVIITGFLIKKSEFQDFNIVL